jgi:hypothetical protein
MTKSGQIKGEKWQKVVKSRERNDKKWSNQGREMTKKGKIAGER